MAMKSITLIRTYARFLVCLAALLLAACGSTSPTSPEPGPSPSPNPTPSPTPSPTPTPPPSSGVVSIAINPNPVAETGVDVSGCDGSTPFRWRWDQVIDNGTSSAVTFTQRVNFFDGIQVSAPTFTLTVQPGAKHTQTTSWCSGSNIDHTFRTDWVMSDGSRVTGPTVQLRKR